MKKNFYVGLIALTALTVTSCSNDDVVMQSPEVNKAIEFGTYVGRDAVSRGSVITQDGSTSGTATTTLSLKVKGFGVFAYYTNESSYVAEDDPNTQDKESSPCNFMYNQLVNWPVNAADWTYSPIKYWPNDPGDKLTFFAYAPYDDADAGQGEVDNISFNAQTDMSGDPIISFTVNNEVKNQQDLLWSRTENIDKVKNQLPQNGITTTDEITFNFAHALSRIGFTVRAVTDEVSAGTEKLLDTYTTIVLKEVRLVDSEVVGNTAPTTGNFYQSGTLNLNNPVADISTSPATAMWVNKTGAQYFTLTNTHFIDEATDNTNGFVINQDNSATANKLNKDDSYIMIIPRDFGNCTDDDQTNNTPLYVYVEYDVITTDSNVGGTSTVTNHITKPIYINFESGKAYTLNLQLGMTSVKVTADVDAWSEQTGTSVDLPQNTQQQQQNP